MRFAFLFTGDVIRWAVSRMAESTSQQQSRQNGRQGSPRADPNQEVRQERPARPQADGEIARFRVENGGD